MTLFKNNEPKHKIVRDLTTECLSMIEEKGVQEYHATQN